MKATAILPVKRFPRAKQRLMEAIDPQGRAAILKAMLSDVLGALERAERIERVIVVTGEGRAERVAIAAGRAGSTPIEVLREAGEPGHSEAAVLGIIRALSLDASCTALVPGDCPLLDPVELDGALARSEEGSVAVIPDRHGEGTNGLLLAPGDAIGPAFGAGSRERHVDRATRAGWDVRVEELPSMALDLDTPDDLSRLRAALAGSPGLAPATAAALDGMA